ncbi:hypothetical protein IKS38_08720 [bacterium]|nr:hypothetical protein [bacterium]
MKRLNYLLLVSASLMIAICNNSFADSDYPYDAYVELSKSIEEFGKANDIAKPMDVYEEYYKATPKEKWLPLWEKILFPHSSMHTYFWIYLARGHFPYVLGHNNDVSERLRTLFYEKCASSNYFTASEFANKLLECKDGILNISNLVQASENRKFCAKNSVYNIYDLCDVLKLLGLNDKLDEITLKLSEDLRKGDYREFRGITTKEPVLGDMSTCDYLSIPKKNGILKKWDILYRFSLHYNTKTAFLDGLKKVASLKSNCFFLTQYYYNFLRDKELAKELVQSNFPLDKVCTLTEALPEYVSLCRNLNITLDEPYRSSIIFQFFTWQLYYNRDNFCNQAEWFWSGPGLENDYDYDHYVHEKTHFIKPILEDEDYPSFSVIRRLFLISEPEDFKSYLRNKLKKREDINLAMFLAALTEDPEEFEASLKLLTGLENQVGVSCIILNLRENFPASCAEPILEMIRKSKIDNNPDFLFYGKHFKKWCLAKNITGAASEIDAILQNTEEIARKSDSDSPKELKEIPFLDALGLRLKLREKYYKETSQTEWLPRWKKLLSPDDLSEAVTNWLEFAKFPMGKMKDKAGIIKKELKFRLLEACEKEGHFSFQEFIDALINAPTVDKNYYHRKDFIVFSDTRAIEKCLRTTTFYEVADTLVFFDQTNELHRVAEKVLDALDYSLLQSTRIFHHESSICVGRKDGPSRWVADIIGPSAFVWDLENRWSFCKEYGQEDVFLKYAPEALKEHYEALPLLDKYCLELIKQDKKQEAVAFVEKNYTLDKIYHIADDNLESYKFIDSIGWDSKEITKKWLKTQLEDNCERTLRLYDYWYGSNQRRDQLKKEVVQPYLAALPKQDMLTLRRLEEVSETNWFKAFVKEGWEKNKNLIFAIEEACLTEDPKEFAELLSFIAKEGCPKLGDVAFLTYRLNDDSPASCADDMMTLVEKSGMLKTEYNRRFLGHFIEWCEKKGRKDLADKLNSLKQQI